MKRYRGTTILFNLLVYTELIQGTHRADRDDHGIDCSGKTAHLNVIPDTPGNAFNLNDDTQSNFCWKVFAPDNEYRVRLKFSNFQLNEAYDYVKIGDLWDDFIRPDSWLANFSGNVLPEDVISLSRGMWITLLPKKELAVRNETNLAFNLTAEKRKVDINLPCPTTSPLNLSHPLNSTNYSDNDYQLWWINTRSPCTIVAVPERLWLQEQYDFVYLGEDITGPFRRENWLNLTARRETGYLSGQTYISRGTDLVVIFTSNFHQPKPGFLFKVVAKSTDGNHVTTGPNETYQTQTKSQSQTQALLSSSFVTTSVTTQSSRHEQKFYLIVIGVSFIAFAVSALLLVAVIRCYMSITKASQNQTTYRDSWNKPFPVASSASTGSSLGRFISFFRHPEESFSSSTSSSGTFSSSRFSFSSSLYSDYTSSSSSHRSSLYSRIRSFFSSHSDGDDFSVYRRGHSSGNLLTTFHPQSSQDTSVDSPSEETSVQTEDQGEDQHPYRRISWRMIRNAFGSGRSPRSSFRSARSSIQGGGNRTSTDSSILDTSSLILNKTRLSTDTDSVFTVPRTRMKVQHTYFKGFKVGYDPVSQTINSDASVVSGGAVGGDSREQPAIKPELDDAVDWSKSKRKILHTYFKGRARLSSSSSVLGRPLSSIPDRHRGDDMESLINDNTDQAASCSPTVTDHDVKP